MKTFAKKIIPYSLGVKLRGGYQKFLKGFYQAIIITARFATTRSAKC